jgi:lipopolysaccharide biosynthesis glycosyltransferase
MTRATPGPIVVASTADANFLPYVGVVAASMARFASPDRPIDYRVFYSGPESAETKALDGCRMGPVTIRLVEAPADFERFQGRSRMGVATLLRLRLADVVRDVDRLLFLDVDLLVRADIGELYDAELGGRPIGGVVDFTVYAWLERQRRDPPTNPIFLLDRLLRETIGFTADNWNSYQNTGVIVMDLEALRAEDFGNRAMALLEERVDKLPWADQDCINILLKDRLAVLDPKWNVLTIVLKDLRTKGLAAAVTEGIRRQLKDRAIVHFAGPMKPWQRTSHVPHAGEWWHFAEQSPTYPAIKAAFHALRLKRRRARNPITALATYVARIRYGGARQRH